jgi:endonuclease/exonuclease/phosphatase family metal-dependent hydrolase
MKIRLIIIILFSMSLNFSCKRDDTGNNLKPTENPYENGYGRRPNSIRLATYNVARCTPSGSAVADYDLTASVISAIAPDVIALQELDSINRRNQHFQLKELAVRTGMAYTYGYTILFQDGKYGNGILSRDTPLRVYNEDITRSEQRKFLAAEFQDYVFMATHLDHNDEEYRIRSARQISSWVEERFGDYDKPVFLAGDFNDPDPGSDMYKILLEKWDIISTREGRTYTGGTSKDGDYVIDYILLWKGNRARISIIGTGIPEFDDIDTWRASDHLPVIVDIDDKLSSRATQSF